MNTDKATARPWKFRPVRFDKWAGEIVGNTPDGEYVASVVSRENFVANAALICRAVNSHDALILALEELIWELKARGADVRVIDNPTRDKIIKANQALALAKGE